MSSSFIGRSRESTVLLKAYQAPASAFIPIYGRRRVGKSELIVHFMKNKPGVYHLGKKAPRSLNIAEFLQNAATTLGMETLSELSADNWKPVFKFLTENWKGKGKLILVLDEFQWLVESSPELPSVIQELWDRDWSRNGKIMLLICGSYIGFMEREVLGSKSPLYGRRTAQIHLKPFDFREAAQFHPRLSTTDKAKIYFICGGIPFYLKMFDASRSTAQNISTNFCNEFAPLFAEPTFLLKEELRDLGNYHAILHVLAQRRSSLKRLSDLSGIDSRALGYYLSQLSEIGYVGKRQSLSHLTPGSRQTCYEIADPLLRFWFHFIFPHASRIVTQTEERAYSQLIGPNLESYMGMCFERLCRQALAELYIDEGITATFEIGEYWDKTTQIDVVGLRQDGRIDLAECKWGTIGSVKKLLKDIELKAGIFPNPKDYTIVRRVFTRTKLANNSQKQLRAQGVICHTLEQLYSHSSEYFSSR